MIIDKVLIFLTQNICSLSEKYIKFATYHKLIDNITIVKPLKKKSMKKFILYSIPFFFINMMLLFSCSENANDMLTTAKASSVTTYVEENVSLDYTELGKLPEV